MESTSAHVGTERAFHRRAGLHERTGYNALQCLFDTFPGLFLWRGHGITHSRHQSVVSILEIGDNAWRQREFLILKEDEGRLASGNNLIVRSDYGQFSEVIMIIIVNRFDF